MIGKVIVGDFQFTGANKIDVDFVCKKWNHLWFITQWHEQFRLTKSLRKNSRVTQFKTTISESQALEIIKRLELVQIKSEIFKNGSTWRKNQ